MSVSIIFLMLQSLAMDSAAISGWSIKQAEFIAACYWGNREMSPRRMPRLELNAAVFSVKWHVY